MHDAVQDVKTLKACIARTATTQAFRSIKIDGHPTLVRDISTSAAVAVIALSHCTH